MKRFLFFISAIITLLTSCDDTTGSLGGSLTDISDNVIISTDEFNIVSESVKGADLGEISARSNYTYLGKLYDIETQSYVAADFMTQILPLTNQYLKAYNAARIFPGIDSLYVCDDDGKPLPYGKNLTPEEREEKMKYLKADSCYLTFYVADFQGDSLSLMSINVKELSKPYLESEDYSIVFNPEAEGMVRTDAGSIDALRTYSIKNMVAEGVGKSASHSHYISVPLNKEYTGRDGVTYSNYGTYLMKQYLDENAAFHNGYNSQVMYLKNICPGFYLKHIGGEGAMSFITATSLTTYYRTTFPSSATPDLVHKVQAVFSGTEESIQHSTISDTSIDDLVSESNLSTSDFTYLKSPHAIYTQLTLNVEEMMQGHDNDSLSTVRIFVQRLNNETTSEYAYDTPYTLMLIPVDSVKTFFEKKKVSDSRSSYLTTYSSSVNGYTFGNISTLVTTMYRNYKAGKASENWNKVVLIPVELSTSSTGSTTVITKVSHSMALEGTRLRKGTLDNAAIKASVIYSRYKE